MGNGVSLKCPNECLTRIDNVNKTHISPNIQVNNFLPLNSISNSYININNSFYKINTISSIKYTLFKLIKTNI